MVVVKAVAVAVAAVVVVVAVMVAVVVIVVAVVVIVVVVVLVGIIIIIAVPFVVVLIAAVSDRRFCCLSWCDFCVGFDSIYSFACWYSFGVFCLLLPMRSATVSGFRLAKLWSKPLGPILGTEHTHLLERLDGPPSIMRGKAVRSGSSSNEIATKIYASVSLERRSKIR